MEWSLARRVVVTLHNPLPLSVELHGQPPPKYVQPVIALNIEHLLDSPIPTTASSTVHSVQTCTPFNPVTRKRHSIKHFALRQTQNQWQQQPNCSLLIIPCQANQGTHQI